MEADRILAAVYDCVDEVNRQQPSDARLTKSAETVLVGSGGVLDSLGLISLLVAIEEKLESQFGLNCFLLDEEILVDPDGPFRTLGGLSEWVVSDSNKRAG